MKSKKLASISAPNHLRIGEYHAAFGGAFAGIMRGTPGQPDYYLFVARSEDIRKVNAAFGPRNTDVPSAASDLDGLANTRALCAHKGTHPAAEWAAGLAIHGFKDYYLPARHELRLCYLNVPELFDTSIWHWSSTQYAGGHYDAWGQTFGHGGQGYDYKDYVGRARAVRRLIIL